MDDNNVINERSPNKTTVYVWDNVHHKILNKDINNVNYHFQLQFNLK